MSRFLFPLLAAILFSCSTPAMAASGPPMPWIGSGYVLPVGDIVCNRFADCTGTGCGFAPCVSWGYSMSVDLFYALLDGIAKILTQEILLVCLGFAAFNIFWGLCRWLGRMLTKWRK